jgi:hypothetical protein
VRALYVNENGLGPFYGFGFRLKMYYGLGPLESNKNNRSGLLILLGQGI